MQRMNSMSHWIIVTYTDIFSAWTSSSSIIDYSFHLDCPPDVRKRAISPLLQNAMSLAKSDLASQKCQENDLIEHEEESDEEEQVEMIEEEIDIVKDTIRTSHVGTSTNNSRNKYDRGVKGTLDHLMLFFKKRHKTIGGVMSVETKSFIGLQNLGNTCYINSALQCLNCLPLFTSSLRQFFSDKARKYGETFEWIANNSVLETSLLESFYLMLELLSYQYPILSKDKTSTQSVINSEHKLLIGYESDNQSDEESIDPIGDYDTPSDMESSSTNSSSFEGNKMEELNNTLVRFRKCSGDKLDPKYHTDQLQDINEFITHLLEAIHQQLKQVSLSENNTYGIETNRRDHMEWSTYFKNNQSCVVDSFDGLFKIARTCPSGHTFLSYEIFRTLTLHFKNDNEKQVSLSSLLKNLKMPEMIECRCSSCGGKENKLFKQVSDVYLLPQYLIITLGRFQGATNGSKNSWWGQKIKTRVRFPTDRLDMSAYFDIAPNQDHPLYNLVAVSNHKGSSLHGGHYFSYVRASINSSTWILLNDTLIKTVHKNSIITNQAYMLFYERVSR